MRHQNSVLHSVLGFVPWGRFQRLVDAHEADRRIRRLSTRSQFVALIQAQLSGATSLREIEATMASHAPLLYHVGAAPPKRSTLAEANAQRPAALFAAVFEALLAQAHPGLRKASKEAVRLIDSSRITLNALSRGWAHYDATCDGVKLHVVYDPEAAMPVHFAVSPARENDLVAAKRIEVEPGATYVFDLGYCSFSWWAALDQAGCRFVTRLRKNSPVRLIEERPVEGENILADRVVRVRDRLGHTRNNPLCSDLREIHVVIDGCKTLRLVTNDLESPARTIADLYKTRWEIELFFRWVKQTLKIRKFLGISENAVRIQIAAALVAYLLLKLAHAAQTAVPSLLTFARLVRANLMHRKTIQDLGRKPWPAPPDTTQMQLTLSLTGQP